MEDLLTKSGRKRYVKMAVPNLSVLPISKNMMLTASVAAASTSESTSYRLMHITSLAGENLRASVTCYKYNTDVPLGEGLG